MENAANHILLKGNSYEAGTTLGEFYKNSTNTLDAITIKEAYTTKEENRTAQIIKTISTISCYPNIRRQSNE